MTKFLMVDPEHYRVDYSINPWMKPEEWDGESWKTAQSQWEGLRGCLQSLGAEIEVEPSVPNLSDLVFTANHAVVLDEKVCLANFRHPERRREERLIASYFSKTHKTLKTLIAPLRTTFFEGAGDCIWDQLQKQFWFGHGQRSDLAMIKTLQRFFEVPVVPLELIDPRFYHLDTAFHVLPKGEIMFYPGAFSKAAQERIYDLPVGPRVLALSEREASEFTANAISWDKFVVMSSCNDELRKFLENSGYKIHTTPLTMFHKSGGSAYCLTLRLDNRRD